MKFFKSLAFDKRVGYALRPPHYDINDTHYECLKTYKNFVRRMTVSAVITKVFDQVTPAFVKKQNVNTSYVRIDSTNIKSNMKNLSRLRSIPQNNS
jgi:hypothetical protein